MAKVLQCSDLRVPLSGREVVKGINFSVDAGEFLGLLGPNGAGKTTLMRAILGLIPSQGNIHIDGRIGYVPQRHEFAWDYPIDVYHTVLNGRAGMIGWLRRPKVADFAAVDAALEQVRLTHLADRPIGELSGGQRQRVLVARALATKPQLLLFDEPFTGLDNPSTELLLGLFEELAQAGNAIMMSTHNLPEAMAACHRVLLFNGEVVATGAPSQMLEAQPWKTTFRVEDGSPLLVSLGIGKAN